MFYIFCDFLFWTVLKNANLRDLYVKVTMQYTTCKPNELVLNKHFF